MYGRRQLNLPTVYRYHSFESTYCRNKIWMIIPEASRAWANPVGGAGLSCLNRVCAIFASPAMHATSHCNPACRCLANWAWEERNVTDPETLGEGSQECVDHNSRGWKGGLQKVATNQTRVMGIIYLKVGQLICSSFGQRHSQECPTLLQILFLSSKEAEHPTTQYFWGQEYFCIV